VAPDGWRSGMLREAKIGGGMLNSSNSVKASAAAAQWCFELISGRADANNLATVGGVKIYSGPDFSAFPILEWNFIIRRSLHRRESHLCALIGGQQLSDLIGYRFGAPALSPKSLPAS
jgi:hypothetical protein